MLPLWRHPTGKVTPESDQLPTVAVFADQVLIGFRHVRELHVRGVPLQCRYGFVLSEILPADAHGRGGQGDGFRAVRGIDEVPRGSRTALEGLHPHAVAASAAGGATTAPTPAATRSRLRHPLGGAVRRHLLR